MHAILSLSPAVLSLALLCLFCYLFYRPIQQLASVGGGDAAGLAGALVLSPLSHHALKVDDQMECL